MTEKHSSDWKSLDWLFQPRSMALAGITVANPEHWTRVFLESMLEIGFAGQMYLVNPRGGEIAGRMVYRSMSEIPHPVDYVISTVSAQVAPQLVRESYDAGARAIHFCTAGFAETGEDEGIRLEAEVVELATRLGIRIIGPNGMGIYCPKARLSFDPTFPKENGPVAMVSQSGGNAINIIRRAKWRGVRFSKVISYGNACDLNESDFIEYLADDEDTKVIALYIEGVRDGRRFLQALTKAAGAKPVVLLKGGITGGGARAASGHTGSLAGDEIVWQSLCRQLGIIQVHSLEEMTDMLVTLLFLKAPKGRNVALLGAGGGNSVLVTDEFEKNGLRVPPLSDEIRRRIREFTPIAGNILRNPIDYSQNVLEAEKLGEVVSIMSHWEKVDLVVGFFTLGGAPPAARARRSQFVDGVLRACQMSAKPVAIVFGPGIVPEEGEEVSPLAQRVVASGLPLYYSFDSAASAINLVLNNGENRASKLIT